MIIVTIKVKTRYFLSQTIKRIFRHKRACSLQQLSWNVIPTCNEENSLLINGIKF